MKKNNTKIAKGTPAGTVPFVSCTPYQISGLRFRISNFKFQIVLYPVFCILSSFMLFGDTWNQTTTSDFNTAGSSAVQTEVINDTVQLAGQSDWWKPAENWPSAMSAWQYRKAITINNSGASPLSDYQVKIENPVYNETGLAGSWHFEETAGTTTGTIADSSGNGNNGTMNNFAGPNGVIADGRFGNAVSFDGSDDCIKWGSINWNFADNWTVEAWYKQTTASNDKTIWQIGNSLTSGEANAFKLVSNYVYMANSAGSYFKYYSGIPTFTNTWTHTVLIWNGASLNVYQNGFNITSQLTKNNDAAGSMTNTNRALWIGGASNNGSTLVEQFNGAIDEIRIYNRALSPDEIQAHYNAKAKPNYGDIRFTGNSGTEFPYWMEKNGTFWVKVEGTDSIPVGLSNIFMYYGNSSAAGVSNGTSVFDFFDDFDDGSIADWTITGSGTTVDASTAKSASGSYSLHHQYNTAYGTAYKSYTAQTGSFIAEWYQLHSSSNSGLCFGNGTTFSDYNGAWVTTSSANPGKIVYYADSGDVVLLSYTANQWYSIKTVINPVSQNIKVYIDNSSALYDGDMRGNITSFDKVNIPVYTTGYNTYIDNTRIRKYASPEPAITIGSEITQTDQWDKRRLITVNAADAVPSGYSVKADIDLESMRFAGDVQNDLDDLRVVAYDRTGAASYELDRDVIKGQGVSFNGSNYVSAPDYDYWGFGSTDFTIEMWTYFNSATTPGSLIGQSQGGGPNPKWNIFYDYTQADTLVFETYVGGDQVISVPWTKNANQWYHLAITRSGNNWYFFANGTQLGTTQSSSVSIPNVNSALRFGTDGESYRYHNGLIDEVRISKNARYTSDFTPQNTPFIPDANTTGLWHLDGDARDYSRQSSTNNNGTLSGSPYYTEGKVIKSKFEANAVSISASIGNSGTGPIANANDGAWNNIWDALDSATYPGVTVTLQYSLAFTAGNFATEFTGNNNVTMTLKGSNNGTDWTDITSSGAINYTGGNTRQDFTFSNSTAYLYYRVLYVTATVNCSSSDVREVVFYADPGNELWFKTQSAIDAGSDSEATDGTGGQHSYYLYFSNAFAGSAIENTNNVYLIQDSFNVLSANWIQQAGVWPVSAGILTYPGAAVSYLKYNSQLSASAGYIVEARAKTNDNLRTFDGVYLVKSNSTLDYSVGIQTGISSDGNNLSPMFRIDGAGDWGTYDSQPNIWYTLKTYVPVSGNAVAYIYNDSMTLLASNTAVSNTASINNYFGLVNTENDPMKIDWFKVRLYTPNEPVLSSGSEDFPYNISGTFTSSVKDTGGSDSEVETVSWNTIGFGTIQIQVRADNDNNPPVTSWENVLVSGSAPSNPVTGRYVQYRALYSGDGSSAEPVLADITVSYTLPIVPPADSVSCDKLTGSWYSTATFTFTNTTGFGPQINRYYYVWDNNTSYSSYTGAESLWTTGVLPLNAVSDGAWYFHYKPYSSTDTAGTAQDLGPFRYDGTAPPAMTLSSPLNNASISESTASFTWGTVTDLSGVTYTLQLDNYTSFSSPVINKTDLSDPANPPELTYSLSGTGAEILIGNSTYYWRVIAVDGASNMSYMSDPSYYKFTTTSTIPQMINESTGEMYASVQDAINSVSTTDGDTISIEDTIAHTENIMLTKDITLENGILSPSSGFAVAGQGTAGGEILRNCVITSGGISNLALGENLTIFSSDSSVIVIENSHLVNCLIEFGTTITDSTLENCDVEATSDYFVSASTGDFRLKSTAVSAIDQGINLSTEFTTDIDGNTKGVDVLDITNFDTGAWDIGAYEYIIESGYSNPTEYVLANVSPSGLFFSAQYGTPVTLFTQVITVSKGTQLDFDWAVQDDADWLTVSPDSGTVGSAASVNVIADIISLPAGIYEAVITLDSDTAINAPVEIPVNLVIYESPEEDEGLAVLSTNPLSVSFYVTGESSGNAIKQLSLSNTGMADLNWTLSEELEWLSADTATGFLKPAEAQTVTFSVNAAGLDDGIHTGIITITSAEAVNSPVQIPVSVYKTGVAGIIPNSVQGISMPSKPDLLYPVSGQQDIAAPLLAWENMSNATYWLQIGKDMDFTEMFVNKILEKPEYQAFGMASGQVYFWRVKAVNSAGTSEWSDTYWFRIKNDLSAEESNSKACFINKLAGNKQR